MQCGFTIVSTSVTVTSDLLAERRMHKFKSMHQAQRFLGAHAAVYNLFNLGRHLVSAENYRYFRLRAFASWEKAVAI
jgi:putative transposase